VSDLEDELPDAELDRAAQDALDPAPPDDAPDTSDRTWSKGTPPKDDQQP